MAIGSATVDLREIPDFGGIDADEDELLRECFQDHPAYLAARGHSRFLVVGRKGSGKTAIYKKLITERSPAAFSYGHTFDDYPWDYHDLQAQNGVPEERRYIHSWKYLILLSLGKILLNSDQSQPWSDAAMDDLIALESFVVDSYGSRDPDLTQIFTPDRELRLSGTLKLPLLNISGETIRVRELPLHFQEINRSMTERTLNVLNPEHDYYVCFDQLDLGFSAEDPKYSQRVIGLILAARDFMREARDAGKRLSVIVFLRDDIYELLHFEDKNKITENYMSLVEWQRTGEGLTLKALMERRFGEVTRGDGYLEWDVVFDEAKEMPSRQTKYAHICDRTFLRPRDMIKFCNEILDSYKTSHAQTDLPGQFDNQAVIDAREKYSRYLLRELDDEIAKHVPAYKDYLEVVKSLGSQQFTREQFNDKWSSRSGLNDDDPLASLERLFEFSVIGYLKPGGGGGGSKYVWRYLDPGARFDAGADTFRVHPGFKEALDLTYGAA